jgi:excisionase family DNA binding protein
LEVAKLEATSENKERREYVSAPLLSPGEAAKYLGVGRRIIYQLIEQGELIGVKVDGAVRIEKKSLDEFLASGKLT